MNLSDTLVYNQANNIYFSTRDTIFISSLTEDYIYIVLVISAFEVYNKKHKSVFNKKHYRAPIIQPITDPLFSQPIILLISKYVLRPCVYHGWKSENLYKYFSLMCQLGSQFTDKR